MDSFPAPESILIQEQMPFCFICDVIFKAKISRFHEFNFCGIHKYYLIHCYGAAVVRVGCEMWLWERFPVAMIGGLG